MSSTPHSPDHQQTESVSTTHASGPQPQVTSGSASGPQHQVWYEASPTQAQAYPTSYAQQAPQQQYDQGHANPYEQQYLGGGGTAAPTGWLQRPFSGDRPATVTSASVLTWVGSVVYLLGGLMMIFVGAGAYSVSREVDWAGSSSSDAEGLGWLGLLVCVIGLASFVLAVFAHHGERWAVIALSGLGGLLFVISVFAAVQYPPMGMLSLIWLATALALYWVTPSQRYYTWRQQRG